MNGYVHQRKNMTGAVNIKAHKLDVDSGTLHVDSVNNRVGVGTKTPTTKLDVVGGIAVSGNVAIDTNTLVVDSTNNRVGICTTNPTVALDVTGGSKISGDLAVDTNTLVVDSTNNRVGVCTTSPTVALDVTGAGKISGDLAVDTNTLVVDSTNNRVGVCVTNPSYVLDVTGDANVSNAYRVGGASVLNSNTLGAGVVNAYLTSIKAFHTSSAGQSIGALNIVNGTNNGTSTYVGTFQRYWGWDTAGTTHSISESYFICNSNNDNYVLTIRVFCSNKASSDCKLGVLVADLVKANGASPSVTTISTTKSASLTTFTITNSGDDLSVTTDSDCCISWIVQGAV
jgi:hypothetical protein